MPHSKAGPTVLPTSPQLVSAMADRITPSRHFTAQVRPGPGALASPSGRNRRVPRSLSPAAVRGPPRGREPRTAGVELCVCLAPCTHYIITAKIPFVKALFGEFEGSESEVGRTDEFRGPRDAGDRVSTSLSSGIKKSNRGMSIRSFSPLVRCRLAEHARVRLISMRIPCTFNGRDPGHLGPRATHRPRSVTSPEAVQADSIL